LDRAAAPGNRNITAKDGDDPALKVENGLAVLLANEPGREFSRRTDQVGGFLPEVEIRENEWG